MVQRTGLRRGSYTTAEVVASENEEEGEHVSNHHSSCHDKVFEGASATREGWEVSASVIATPLGVSAQAEPLGERSHSGIQSRWPRRRLGGCDAARRAWLIETPLFTKTAKGRPRLSLPLPSMCTSLPFIELPGEKSPWVRRKLIGPWQYKDELEKTAC